MEAREAHSQRAVALARESGDPEALFVALHSRLTALLGPDDIGRRLGLATELLELAIRRGSREKVFVARESRIRALMALGDISAMDREIEACDELAEELRVPVYRRSLSRFRLARALADGHLDEAERLNRVIAEFGRKSDDASAEFLFDILTGWIQYLRGDLPATRNLAETLVGRVSVLGAMPGAFAAFLYAEIDEPEPAFKRLVHGLRVAGTGADAKQPGNFMFILGRTSAQLGGSHMLLVEDIQTGNDVPPVDMVTNVKVMKALQSAIEAGLVRGCHDLSEGGLAVAAAEMAFSGGLGMEIALDAVVTRDSAGAPAAAGTEPGGRRRGHPWDGAQLSV